jgi:hypothetical protein
LKAAFRQKHKDQMSQGAPTDRKEKPYSSIFKGPLNEEFLKSGVLHEEEVMVLAQPKPADFQAMLEMQQEAEDRYAKEREEDERKFEGLTALQKKKLILAELEEA